MADQPNATPAAGALDLAAVQAYCDAATREAERLVDTLGAECVVYVPLVRVTPPRARCTETITQPQDVRASVDLPDDDLPF